jgi:hypothetical protein
MSAPQSPPRPLPIPILINRPLSWGLGERPGINKTPRIVKLAPSLSSGSCETRSAPRGRTGWLAGLVRAYRLESNVKELAGRCTSVQLVLDFDSMAKPCESQRPVGDNSFDPVREP